jgi:hypothetical protein
VPKASTKVKREGLGGRETMHLAAVFRNDFIPAFPDHLVFAEM